MKKLIYIFSCVAAFAGLTAGLSSCDPEYHRRGRGYEPDDGPGRHIDEPGNPSKDDVIEFENGYGEFYGQWYTNDTDNYLLYLYWGNTDEDGYFTDSAVMLTLDLLLPKKGFGNISSCTCFCSDMGGNYTFIPSYEDEDEEGNKYLNGSSLYVQQNAKKSAIYSIVGGKLDILRNVMGQYEITGEITTDNGAYEFHYKGKLNLQDKTQISDIPKNVEMNNIALVEAEDWGMVWEGIPCTSYRDYVLSLYDKDWENTNEYAQIEILTEEKYKSYLPDAFYNKVVTLGNADDFIPGVIIAGYSDEDNYAWGTWYCKDGTAWYAASKGSLEMKESAKGYKIAFDFVDEDEIYGGSFRGSYEGKVEFLETKASSSGKRQASASAKSGRAMAKGRAVPSVHRENARNKVTR